MWTLQARYSPIQMGQASPGCACMSKWWLAAAAVAGVGLTWAATSPKKKGKAKR